MCSESWGQHDTGSARRAFDTGELVMAPPGCTHVARNSTQQMRVRTTHTHLLPRALPHGYLIYRHCFAAMHLGDLQLQRRESAEHGTECDPTRVAMSNSRIQMASTHIYYPGVQPMVSVSNTSKFTVIIIASSEVLWWIWCSVRDGASGSSSYSMRSVWIFTSISVSK